jgi:ribonuclease HII
MGPSRSTGLWNAERALQREGFARVAGVDEAGRGTLAGPVVAAAVIFPPACRLEGLADSKTLRPAVRERLYDLIREHAICTGVGVADARTVDRENVLGATHLAMRQAIAQLYPPADFLLVDGRGLPAALAPQRAIVGGDGSCASIAAASIVAKVVRDRMMTDLDDRFPGYGFVEHKGYATQQHLSRLRELGPCAEHRTTFAPVRAVLQSRLPFASQSDGTP